MLKAVIFDFDGVICDSEDLHYRVLNEVFNRYGVDIPRAVHWEKYLGYSDLDNVEAVNRDYAMGLDDAGVRKLMAEKKAAFEARARTETPVFDGVGTFVRMLAANGIHRAICSGALRSDIDLMLEGLDFAGAFEIIVSADDVTNNKPDPEGYRLALDKLNAVTGDAVNPADCIVIEDSHWGIEAAVAAGMNPVAVTNTYQRHELNGKAHLVVDRLDHISMDTLRRLCGK